MSCPAGQCGTVRLGRTKQVSIRREHSHALKWQRPLEAWVLPSCQMRRGHGMNLLAIWNALEDGVLTGEHGRKAEGKEPD